MGAMQITRQVSMAPNFEVTTMWQLNYHNRPEFLDWFGDEQDYVDAMFILIIYQNFGILLRHDMLNQS
jgi:hypothetical protein